MKKIIILAILILILAGIQFFDSIHSYTVPIESFDDPKHIRDESPDMVKILNSNYYQDPGSREIYFSLNSGYTMTPVKAHYDTFILPFPDYSPQIGRDKDHIYVDGKINSTVDPATLTSHKRNDRYDDLFKFFNDKNGFYALARGENNYDISVLLPISFDPRAVDLENRIIRSLEKVYVLNSRGIVEVPGADPETFHEIGPCYSVEMSGASFYADMKNVYVEDSIALGIDPKTLSLIAQISSDSQSEIPYSIYLWKDKSNVYAHCGELVKEADLATFNYIGNGIAADKNNQYRFHTGGSYVVTAIPPYYENSVYINPEYGFSLNFPSSWIGYQIQKRNDMVEFGFVTKDVSWFQSLFYISRNEDSISCEEWNKPGQEEPHDICIVKEGGYIYHYGSGQSFGPELDERFSEVESIIKSFKLIPVK